MRSLDCPDDTALQALFDGALDQATREALSSHLGECDACRALVADLARASATSTPGSRAGLAASDEHARGETLGR